MANNKNKRTLFLVIWLAIASLMSTAIASRASFAADSRNFPETGHTVQGLFLNYWNTRGGLAQQGYPISEELQEQNGTDGKVYTVQYFQRAVFEYHPENVGTQFEVLLSLLGVFYYNDKYSGSAPAQRTSTDNPRLFDETGFTIGGAFREYWESHGGLAQQGYPISEEFTEVDKDGTPRTVQYFQRAVFEYHSEYAGTPSQVLLSLLGVFYYDKQHSGAGTPTPPSATPTPAPPPTSRPIDSAVVWNNGKAYFFSGNQYIRYDVATDRTDDIPHLISDGWRGLFTSNIDAAVMWNNGKAYFFSGNQYVRYDVATDKTDDIPHLISDGWKGVTFSKIDAVVMWNNGKAYFFSGNQYIRYDVATDRTDDIPHLISDGWRGLFTSNIDAAVMWNNGKAYFFKGNQYVRYDVATDRTDDIPHLISDGWRGLVFP